MKPSCFSCEKHEMHANQSPDKEYQQYYLLNHVFKGGMGWDLDFMHTF